MKVLPEKISIANRRAHVEQTKKFNEATDEIKRALFFLHKKRVLE